MALDVKAMNRNDQVVAGAGVAMLIASFLAWYTVKSSLGSASLNGWDMDFFGGKLAIILSVLAAAYVLARAAGVDTDAIKVNPRLLVLILAGVALLLVLLQWTAADDVPKGLGLEAGWSLGFYLALLLTIAQTVFAFLAFQAAGGMSAARGGGDGMTGSGAAPMPPTGYAAPQPPPPPAGDTGYPPPAE